MKRSTNRILCSHAGTLPKPADLQSMLSGNTLAQDTDEAAFFAKVPDAIKAVVRRQVEAGMDVVNDGEYGKLGGFSSYVRARLGGLEERDDPRPARSIIGRDVKDFPQFHAAGLGGFRNATQRYEPGRAIVRNAPVFCTGPITYLGAADVQRDIANLKAAMQGVDAEAYLPAIAPGTIEHWLWNEHYNSDEEFLFAIADAMHDEYKAITDAGFILQIDDPDLPDGWQIYPEMSVADYQKYAAVRVEALNHALRDVPESQVRFHICWGSNHGPHKHDIPLADIIDLTFAVKAECVSIEASNPRHEHEWQVFESFKMPEGRSLMPGVIGHVSDTIEHPELVKQRLVRYANLVGRENVIAGTDCGIGSRVGNHEVAWAKLEAMAEGARLATQELWRK